MRKCKTCRQPFKPTYNTIQPTCSVPCAIEYTRQAHQKSRKEADKAFKKKFRDSDRPWHIKTLEKIFNKFIRLRDDGDNCISCGRTDADVKRTDGWKTGGAWDCGHFLSVGSHPELRFCELNAYRQCKSCNGGSGKYTKKRHTVSKEYRINLVARIGLDKVEWLEGPHEPAKYTIPELQEMIKEYRAKIREMENT